MFFASHNRGHKYAHGSRAGYRCFGQENLCSREQRYLENRKHEWVWFFKRNWLFHEYQSLFSSVKRGYFEYRKCGQCRWPQHQPTRRRQCLLDWRYLIGSHSFGRWNHDELDKCHGFGIWFRAFFIQLRFQLFVCFRGIRQFSMSIFGCLCIFAHQYSHWSHHQFGGCAQYHYSNFGRYHQEFFV